MCSIFDYILLDTIRKARRHSIFKEQITICKEYHSMMTTLNDDQYMGEQ